MTVPNQSPIEEFKQGLQQLAQQAKGTTAEPILQESLDAIADYESAADQADELLLQKQEAERQLRNALR